MSEIKKNFYLNLDFVVRSAVKYGNMDEMDADYILNVAEYDEQVECYLALIKRRLHNEG